MAIYSIRDVEKLCGIKAHTIRIWEQRYKIVEPKRTSSNIRYYQEDDLKHLLNIALLNRNGYRISAISQMAAHEIEDKVAQISSSLLTDDTQLDALTLSMIEMDEYKFDKIITNNIQKAGFERTMLQVIYPFLEKLNLLWLTGAINPVQEHFVSNLIRQKIIAAIDRIPVTLGLKNQKFALFLPEGDEQELSLLLINYILKSRKHKVLYLGKNISLGDLRDVIRLQTPDYLYTILPNNTNNKGLRDYIDEITEILGTSKLIIAGAEPKSNDTENILFHNGLEVTRQFLDTLTNGDAVSDSLGF